MVEHDLDADADEDDAAGDRRGFFPTVAELMADCHAAKRDDERRDADQSNRRLFPVEKAPFYAAKFQPAMMLVCCGGLESDEDCHTFTEITDDLGRQVCGDIIPGLYVAGNMQGGRFGLQYPIGLKGVSHAMAMYYGKVAGENAVKGV